MRALAIFLTATTAVLGVLNILFGSILIGLFCLLCVVLNSALLLVDA